MLTVNIVEMISAYECILNAVQCNITILTTKSKWYSWSAAFIWFCWLGAHFTTLLACSSMMVPGMFWSYDWAVYCTTLMYLSQSFRHPPPPPPSLLLTHWDRHLGDFMDLMAGLQGLTFMGVLCLGAGWSQWRSLDIRHTHLPYSMM